MSSSSSASTSITSVFSSNTTSSKSSSTLSEVENVESEETLKTCEKSEKRTGKFFKIFRCLFRPVLYFFTSEPEQCHTMKMLFGFPFGALLGYGLYNLVVSPMDLPTETMHVLGAMTVFGTSAGYSLSVSFRCICILLVPTFMGKAGRSYIGTFAIAYLIAGPIKNIVDNTQDITRSLTCSAELSANHTAAKWKFRLQPVGNVMKDMAAEGWMLNKLGKKVNKAFTPIKSELRGDNGVEEMKARTKKEDELEGGIIDRSKDIDKDDDDDEEEDDGKKLENKYKKKIRFQCEDIFNQGVKACRKVFDNLENKCRDKIPDPLDDFLCELVNVGFLCKLVDTIGRGLGGECEPNHVIRPSFGKMYKKSEDSVDNMEKGFDIKLQYKVIKGKEDVDYTSIEEMRGNTMQEFKHGRKWVEFVMLLIKRILGFTFVLVIISAYKYHKNYKNDLRFDNIYITSYFRKIDARRKYRGKKVLLPLKKMERARIIFPTSLTLMKSEKRKVIKGSLLLLLRAILSSLVFLIANIMYRAMSIIRQYSRVDYRQTGSNTIDIKIGGNGFMSNIVRLFLNGLNTKSQLDEVSSNIECLPRPVPIEAKYYYYVFGIYFLIWILILVDAFALRLRKTIAAFFYRKREKVRVLYLYNIMMKKRKFFLRDMQRKVKRQARKLQLRSRSGLIYSLSHQFPTMCSCLKIFKASKDKCLICKEQGNKTFIKCIEEQCNFMYCPECWKDINKTCYACLPLDEFSSTDSDSIDDEDTDDDD
ncbi:DC-STAMP domain-containing protein [Mactra antiquata]